jgi:hypothetical protein
MTDVSSFLLREQLVATLEETLRIQRQLVDRARDPRVTLPDLIAQVSLVERLDDHRDELLAGMRREAKASSRAERGSPPVREVVLSALTEFGCPQNARFLGEYLWTHQQLQLDSRALAPLRRDEQRAWLRAPGAREAYIAPALHEDGTPNTRWITSSAWDLERRIVAPGQPELLLDVHKILVLTGGQEADETERPRRPSDTVLEQYARQVLRIRPLPPSADTSDALRWRMDVRRTAEKVAAGLGEHDERQRKEAAALLAGLPERDRIWGRSAG